MSRPPAAWRGASIACHAGLGEHAVIDPNQDCEHAALLRRIAALHEVFRRAAVEHIARRRHPATGFGFIGEDFESAIADGAGVRMLKFLRQFSGDAGDGPCRLATDLR